MKKQFALTFTTAIATSLVACGQPSSAGWDDDYVQYAKRDTAICVDPRTQQRLPDRECSRGGGGSAAMWYYLGRSSVMPYHGDYVSGGSYTRPQGRTFYHAPASSSMSRQAAISRGGFGSTGRSMSSSAGT